MSLGRSGINIETVVCTGLVEIPAVRLTDSVTTINGGDYEFTAGMLGIDGAEFRHGYIILFLKITEFLFSRNVLGHVVACGNDVGPAADYLGSLGVDCGCGGIYGGCLGHGNGDGRDVAGGLRGEGNVAGALFISGVLGNLHMDDGGVAYRIHPRY